MQPVLSAGEHATRVKRGKTCNLCHAAVSRYQSRENAFISQVAIGFDSAPDWLRKKGVSSDWLEFLERGLNEPITSMELNKRKKQTQSFDNKKVILCDLRQLMTV